MRGITFLGYLYEDVFILSRNLENIFDNVEVNKNVTLLEYLNSYKYSISDLLPNDTIVTSKRILDIIKK